MTFLAFVGWWPWAAAGGVVGLVAGQVLLVGWAVRSASEERRGGLLELDTWEARNALANPDGGPPPSWSGMPPGVPTVIPSDYTFPPPRPTALRRCNPSQRVHFHGEGDWCECGQTANVYSTPGLAFHPFADRGDGAA